MELALCARIHCRGLLGFVALVVHGNNLSTTGSALLVGVLLGNEFRGPESQELSKRQLWRRPRIVAGTAPAFGAEVYKNNEAVSVAPYVPRGVSI